MRVKHGQASCTGPPSPVRDPETDFPPVFSQLLDSGDEHGDNEEEDVNLDLLCDENDDDDEDTPCSDVVAWQLYVGKLVFFWTP